MFAAVLKLGLVLGLLSASHSVAAQPILSGRIVNIHCLRAKETGKFLSDDKDSLWDLCSSGEKWDLAVHEAQSFCIRNNHLRTFLGSQGKADVSTCSSSEYWELIQEGDGSYCVQHKMSGRYLSASLLGSSTLADECGKTERWELIPIQ